MKRLSLAEWSSRAQIILIGAAAVAVLGLVGCGPSKPSAVAPLQREMSEMQAQVAQLQQRIANQQETIESQRKQISSLQQLGPNRPVRLAPLEGIKFASLSGGYDENGDGSDDGVVLYVQPYDADGDSVKAAGELTVRLFDLSNPAGPQLIDQYSWNAEHLRKIWNAKLMTGHYSARCPWPDKYEVPRQVTAQATFVDSLTGKSYTQQAAFPIKGTEPAK